MISILCVCHLERQRFARLTREESSLEDTQDKTKREKRVPLLDETKGNHDHTPDDDDGREKDTGAKLSEYDSGWWLKCNVCNEE